MKEEYNTEEEEQEAGGNCGKENQNTAEEYRDGAAGQKIRGILEKLQDLQSKQKKKREQ